MGRQAFRLWSGRAAAIIGLMIAPEAMAQVPAADSGDTAWILTASALVLMMTLPGLALFYGGLVRSRNVLSVLMHCFAIATVVSILWAVIGYSIAFSPGSPWLGGALNVGLANLADLRDGTTIDEPTFALFQLTFAIITPALIVGAFVERVRFAWVLGFSALWSLIVYAPVAHWIWGGGWLAELGTLDFAGGIVVHTTAGVSALVVALLVGRRTGFPTTLVLPHSATLTLTGAGLLWVGWFGFNGGSALGASSSASLAIMNTQLGASAAALVWILIEQVRLGKPTVVGIATGVIAGLATVTPAAGYVGAMGAIAIGAIGSALCFGAVWFIRQRLKIDDSLDVFAVHGVGGIAGSLLLAPFADVSFGGVGYGADVTVAGQLLAQAAGIGVVTLWSAIATVLIALAVSMVAPMRVSRDQEQDGLDISSHGERGWELD